MAIQCLPVRLCEYRIAVRQLDCTRIVEPAHATQRAEILIEWAILLHHHHDVLDILDGVPAAIGLYGQRLADAFPAWPRPHRRPRPFA